MTRSLRLLTALLAPLLLVGCTGVPSSGPVERAEPIARTPVEQGVQVHPAAPLPDASPDLVLAGFLDAMASLEGGFGVARQYLTPDAARAWRPRSGVTVFDGDTRSNIPGTTAAGLQARVVGELDGQGHYTAITGRTLRHDFTMEQVAGQWRISNPPAGLLVSQYTLLHRFTPTTVWFPARDSRTLVPERVWLASRPASPVEAIESLLAGPSTWLGPSVASAIPAGCRLAVPAVQVSEGVAEIPFDGCLGDLPDSLRGQVFSQVGWTLRAFPEVRAIRILDAGQPWFLPGQRPDGSAQLDEVPGLAPLSSASDEQPFALVGGKVGRLDDQGGFAPLGGQLGTGAWGGHPVEVGASTSSGVVALVNADRTRLHSTPIGRSEPRMRLVAKGIRRPVVTASGEVWTAVDGDGAVAIRHGAGERQLQPVTVPELRGTTVQSLAVSPDQTRLAVVLRRGTATELGVLRIHGGSVDGYRRMPLAVSHMALDEVRDVGWTTPEQLMVLAGTHRGERVSAFLVSADGVQVDPVGPSGELKLVQLATRAQVQGGLAMLRTSTGQVLRYESAWRWHILPQGVDALGAPS